MYYKVNEEEAKIVKHIYNLYIRGYDCDEITSIFKEGDIVYGICKRIDKLFEIMRDILYDVPAKSREENRNLIYEIDYRAILKTRNKDTIENIVIKNLENCITKIQLTKKTKTKLERIMKHYNFLKEEIKRMYTESVETIEEIPKNKKYGALFGYDLVT